MRFPFPVWMVSIIGGSLLSLLGQMEQALAQQPLGKPPAYYVGVGIRTGFNDDTAAVLDTKAKLTDLGDLTLSTRPALLLGNDVEFRLPFSVEGTAARNVYPYGGAGIAYNVDGLSRVDPMLTGGLDIGVARQLVVGLEFNFIFRKADTDTEFAASLNYSF